MQVIIFPQDSGGVSVISVAPEFADQLEAVADKDVPEGKAWRIVMTDDLPSYDTRDRWRWTDDGPLDVADGPPDPVPQSISFAQLLIGLVTEAWISEAEGEAWLVGTLPAAVTAVIDSLPAGQQFPAKARALRPSEIVRNDPLVAAMGAAAGKIEAEIDTFFRTYAQV